MDARPRVLAHAGGGVDGVAVEAVEAAVGADQGAGDLAAVEADLEGQALASGRPVALGDPPQRVGEQQHLRGVGTWVLLCLFRVVEGPGGARASNDVPVPY